MKEYRIRKKDSVRYNVIPKSDLSVIPKPQPSVIPKQAKIAELRGLIENVKPKQSNTDGIPLYNPAIHKVGDTVLMRQGKRLLPCIVPDLDAGGQAITRYW